MMETNCCHHQVSSDKSISSDLRNCELGPTKFRTMPYFFAASRRLDRRRASLADRREIWGIDRASAGRTRPVRFIHTHTCTRTVSPARDEAPHATSPRRVSCRHRSRCAAMLTTASAQLSRADARRASRLQAASTGRVSACSRHRTARLPTAHGTIPVSRRGNATTRRPAPGPACGVKSFAAESGDG